MFKNCAKFQKSFPYRSWLIQHKIYCVESFPKEINSLKIFLIYKWTTYVVKLLFYHQEIKKIQYTRLFTFNSKHFLSAKIGIGKYTRQACVPRKLMGTQEYKVYDVHLNLFVEHELLRIRKQSYFNSVYMHLHNYLYTFWTEFSDFGFELLSSQPFTATAKKASVVNSIYITETSV